MQRINKLRALIDNRYGGNLTKFSQAIKRSPSQVSQWLGGHRKLGDAGVRNIEIELGLPQGWFDLAEPLRAEDAPAAYNVTALPPKWSDELLGLAQSMSDPGRRELIGMARLLARQYPASTANSAS